jgi:hypothetical protein
MGAMSDIEESIVIKSPDEKANSAQLHGRREVILIS